MPFLRCPWCGPCALAGSLPITRNYMINTVCSSFVRKDDDTVCNVADGIIGPIVRVAPNELSFLSARAMDDIFGYGNKVWHLR